MGEMLPPHRVGRREGRTTEPLSPTRSMEMWGTGYMSQTVTLEEGRAYVFVAVEHAT